MVRYSSVQKTAETSEGAGRRPRDEKDEKILTAATEAFLEFGFDGASMDLVAQRASASKTTLYARYPSKEALFVATLERDCEARAQDFIGMPVDDLPVDEALRRIGRRFLDIIWSPQSIRRVQIIQGEAPRFPEIARTFMRAGPGRTRPYVAEYFKRAAARGLIEIADPHFVADQFLASLLGMVHLELMLGLRDMPSEEEKDAFVCRATSLFARGLGIRSGPPSTGREQRSATASS